MEDRKPIYQEKAYEVAQKQIEFNEQQVNRQIDDIIAQVGKKIAEARLSQGYSLRNIDAILGKNVRATVNRIETGDTADINLSLRTVLSVAYIVGLSKQDLFGDEYDSADKLLELVDKLPEEEKKKLLKMIIDMII